MSNGKVAIALGKASMKRCLPNVRATLTKTERGTHIEGYAGITRALVWYLRAWYIFAVCFTAYAAYAAIFAGATGVSLLAFPTLVVADSSTEVETNRLPREAFTKDTPRLTSQLQKKMDTNP
ncbi:MAG: hypothetical protein HN348_14665 [Proteobacteria bacterium]|nr:hypothetical protein [Pseudomonadota bacterium]